MPAKGLAVSRIVAIDVDAYRKDIEARMRSLTDKVMSGNCTIDDYKAKTGEHRGFRLALEAFNETLKKDEGDE